MSLFHNDDMVEETLRALEMKNAALHNLEDMVNNLQNENDEYLRTIQSQSAAILELSQWEFRAHKAERKVKKLVSHQSNHDSLRITELEEKLDACERNLLYSHSQKQQMQNASISMVASLDLELQQQRVHVMEIEEELDQSQMEQKSKLEQISELSALVLSKDAEITALEESLLSVSSVEEEYSSIIHSLQSSLDEKASAVESLTCNLDLVRRRAKQLQDTLHTTTSFGVTKLYNQISGRGVFTIEVPSSSPGFTYEVVPMPVSTVAPCIIVNQMLSSDCALLPGDEILEVNGYLCRSAAQPKALQQLKVLLQGVASVKLVVARTDGVSPLQLRSSITKLEDLLIHTRKQLQEANEERATLTVEAKSMKMDHEIVNKKLAVEKRQSANLQESFSHKNTKMKELNGLMQETQVCTSY